jgi:hypothetical protein
MTALLADIELHIIKETEEEGAIRRRCDWSSSGGGEEEEEEERRPGCRRGGWITPTAHIHLQPPVASAMTIVTKGVPMKQNAPTTSLVDDLPPFDVIMRMPAKLGQ